MRLARLTVLSLGLATCGAQGVLGADLITVPSSAAGELPVHDGQAFNWDGFYTGVYGVVGRTLTGDGEYGIGVQAGVNATFDFYLAGAEVAVEGLTGDVGNTAYGKILGRAGLVATDDVLVYAAGGYGIDLASPEEQNVLLGGGLEVAISDSVSVRGQYLHSFPVQGSDSRDQVSLGATFHF
ncbi:porin family protein [Devosia sp. PTR5]|uniref:Porin family protein n=1 Tax=Devosia oryzisoli TaxID=2774138 RepID=A0A927IRM3_9HYPH|nr:porin family protein [Devosia oryzisoli]MBD8064564.1 porin family protein [Devosia oryzisoli]